MKTQLKSGIKLIIAGQLIIAACLTACHSKQQTQSQSAGKAAPGEENDSTVIHPVIDPNAKDGLNTMKYPDGIIKARGYYSHGKKTGEWQVYEDGTLWSDEHFTDGYPDGPVSVYYDSFGKKMYEGQYRMGKPVGIWKYMNNDGTLKRTADYDKKAPNSAM